jgi:chaperone BCS1
MYSTKLDKKQTTRNPDTTSETSPPTTLFSTVNSEEAEFMKLLAEKPDFDIVDDEKLTEMRDEFTEKLPEGKFSPAEIQGFLLMRKKEPFRALAEVESWRDQMLEAKAKNNRIVQVN